MITPQPVSFQSASLYIGDLANEVTEGMLFEIFNRVGPVASIRVCRDAVTRRSLGYAYLNYHNAQDAERALDTMNFTDIKGRPCRIMWSQRDPTLRKSGVGNIFVKNLNPNIDNKGLFDLFSVFGNILSCKVVTDENGASKGYGYVHYETNEDAQNAINKLNNTIVDDFQITIGFFLRRQERAGQADWTNLYAKQFPLSWDENKLTELFSQFGAVNSVFLSKDESGKSKGFAFLDFKEHSGAEAALKELNGKTFTDDAGVQTELYVSRHQKKSERTRELRSQHDAIKLERMNKYQGMNLYVKNLDDTITDEQLKEFFAGYGTITSARIMKDPNGASRGFGFICFSSPEEATRAVAEMNGKMIKGKPVVVNLHQRKEHRAAHLQATFGGRGMGGMPRGFPMGQVPFMGMYVQGQPMPPRQYQVPGMMARGARPMPTYPGRGGFPGAYGMNQQNMPRRPTPGQPQNQQRRAVPGGRGPQQGMPMQQGRGMPMQRVGAPNVKFSNQIRNQPPMGMAPGPVPSSQPISHQQDTLDHLALAQADIGVQKNMIGEQLYPLIQAHQPELAGKITGMLLEMDNAELIHLLESPEALMSKIEEALAVLRAHSQA